MPTGLTNTNLKLNGAAAPSSVKWWTAVKWLPIKTCQQSRHKWNTQSRSKTNQLGKISTVTIFNVLALCSFGSKIALSFLKSAHFSLHFTFPRLDYIFCLTDVTLVSHWGLWDFDKCCWLGNRKARRPLQQTGDWENYARFNLLHWLHSLAPVLVRNPV